ncbi:hypothetical protein [Rubrobacter aplysinae]|uniref:hypothetical protein n=1 Tax=Rubrobacter aplysinae TaxID=909625 RepID=UPI00064BB510|nr:hypothetical protein [Rubrobacter aplysinae]
MSAEQTASQATHVVDEAEAYRLAEAHNMPPLEVDAALYGESVEHAESVLSWIDAEEGKLVKAYGLLEGRARYKPVKMLKDYSRKYVTGRRRTS